MRYFYEKWQYRGSVRPGEWQKPGRGEDGHDRCLVGGCGCGGRGRRPPGSRVSGRAVHRAGGGAFPGGRGGDSCPYQIPLLRRTNLLVSAVTEETTAILAAALRILAHARACRGCPVCLLDRRRGWAG